MLHKDFTGIEYALRIEYLKHSRSTEEIALMKTIKQALDPRGILNPGKIFVLPKFVVAD